MQAFLAYVVEEALAGRGDLIRAKTIVEDVYGRSPGEGRDPMAVVCVDAGRLRRRLSGYYAGSGSEAALRIHIDAGGYAPVSSSTLGPFRTRGLSLRPTSTRSCVAFWSCRAGQQRWSQSDGSLSVPPPPKFHTPYGRGTSGGRCARSSLQHVTAKLQTANLVEQSRAPTLSPEDVWPRNLDALLSLFSGEFERAIQSTDAVGLQAVHGNSFPHRNVIAFAKFHLGYYAQAIKWYNAAAREGDPISAISLAYLATAQQRVGETEAAAEATDLMDKSWPDFPSDALFQSLFRDPDHAMHITSALEEAAGAIQVPTWSQ